MADKAPAFIVNYNWELAFVLYCGGMEPADILNHKSFRGMPPATLYHRISTHGWAKRREEVALMEKTPMLKERARRLQQELEEEALVHQSFVLSELKRERKVLENSDHVEKGQLTRLEALDRIDMLTRKLTRMDERVDSNPITQGFAILVGMQHAPKQLSSSQLEPSKVIDIPPEYTPSAMMVLPDAQDHSTGILRSKNAMPDESQEPETTEIKPMPLPGKLFGAKPLSE